MLSRVANNLYWMGRYLERADHLARYSKATYFASLDAPILENFDRDFALESMLYMAGIFDMDEIVERDVLYRIGIDSENPDSIVSNIAAARENARGARNVISTDLWEAINKYYFLVTNYPKESFLTTGLYEFTQLVADQTSIIASAIFGTMLHDGEYAVILVGMHIERIIQIIRIINAKLHDIYRIEQTGILEPELSFEWANLLKCLDSLDMSRKYYRSIPNRQEVFEFLLLNPNCPRSVSFSLRSLRRYEENISSNELNAQNSISFGIRKLCSQYEYLTYDEFKDDVYGLLNNTLQKVTEIANNFEKKYLSF